MTTENSSFRRLQASTNVYDATHAFSGFERMSGYNPTSPQSAHGWDRRLAETEAALRALVEANPGCFIRPRTQVFAGIKVGYAKGKGALSFDDADSVVARIKKHLPEQADVLIRTKEAPVKEALAQLSAAELKKIGVTLSEAGDQTVVRPVDSEVDKMVDALLKAATGEEGEA